MGSIPTVASIPFRRDRRPFYTLTLCALAGLLSASVLAGQERPTAEEPRDRLAEEITVFETTLMLDPRELGVLERQRLRPDGILVLEGGAPRRATNLQAPRPGEWRFLVYIDAPLSRSRTVRLAALRLGALAVPLTDLGSVEVIVADPVPRRVFGPSREATPLARELARIAESGLGSDQIQELREAFGEIAETLPAGDARRLEALERERALVRERADRLLLQAARGCEGAPCALFVVSDGFYEEPAAFYLGEARLADPSEPRPAQEAARELAQTVAAYDWIAFPLPLREDRLESPVVAKPRSDFEVFLDHTGAIRPLPKASDRDPELSLDDLEVSVTPILQPLQRMAVESAGRVVRIVADVGEPIEALPQRRRLFYLTDRPLDGEPRPVAARLVDGGTVIPTPAWVRSSTPPAVAGARVRALLSDRAAAGEVPIRARLERLGEGRVALALEAEWGDAAELAAQSRIRVSIGYARPGRLPWVAHQRLVDGAPADGEVWRHRLELALPEEVEQLAVVVEALLPRVWGGTTLER